MLNNNFSIISYEPGFHNPRLPTWTNHDEITDLFDDDRKAVKRIDLPQVPGAFQLLDVLSEEECNRFIQISDSLGYHEDSPVSLPHEVRHNENFNWVVGEKIDTELWERSHDLVPEEWQGQTAKGLNARFRFYKYKKGDFFETHSDGSWTGSRVINGELVGNAYPGLQSHYTYLIFLSDGYEGGGTQFMVSKSNSKKPARHQDDTEVESVYTPKGGVLCFPHGSHPLHCLHRGEEIGSGTKYVIRTDILFG